MFINSKQLKCFVLKVFFMSCFYSIQVEASFVPEGFEHFYNYENKVIELELPDQTVAKLQVKANFDHIESFVNIKKTTEKLLKSGIKADYVKKILENTDKISGFGNDEQLWIEYDADYNHAVLHVPSEYMDGEYKLEEYVNVSPSENALISNNKLYTSSVNGEFSSTFTNESVLGFGSNHVSVNSSVNNGDSIELEELSLTNDFQGSSSVIGYRDQPSSLIDNATSMFDHAYDNKGYYASYYSNDNLLHKNVSRVGRIYFDMKSAGIITVLREGKIIYNDSVLRGQNSVEYSQLPKGNYDVTLVLQPNGYPEERYTKKINNNVSRTSKRGYDYSVSLKSMEFTGENNYYSSDYLDLSYVQSLLDEQVIVNVQSQLDKEDIDVGIGSQIFGNGYQAGAFVSFVNNGYMASVNSSFLGLNIDQEWFKVDEGKSVSNLSAVRYGDKSYSQTSASYSMGVPTGNLGFYLNYYEEYQKNNYEKDIGLLNLSLNYHTNIFTNVGLDLNYNYSRELSSSSSSFDEHLVTANISIPLTDSFSYTSSTDYSSESGSRFTNNINYEADDINAMGTDIYASSYASHYVDEQGSEVTIGGNVSFENNHVKGGIFGYGTNQNQSSVSSNLESTVILTNSNVYATKDRSDSYLILDNDIVGNVDSRDFGLVTMKADGGYLQSNQISGESTLLRLNNYSDYEISVDTEVSGFANINDKPVYEHVFSYPGTVKVVDNKLREVVSFLTYFSDFNDDSLNNIDCIGDGCISISNVGDGIYNISISKGDTFKITSNNQVCLLTTMHLEKLNGTSYCFPTIDETDDGMQLVSDGLGDDDDVIYYLGIKDNFIPKNVIREIAESGMSIIEHKFGDKMHLFAKVNSEIGQSQLELVSRIELLSKIQEYASYNQDVNKYTVIR